jgi:hypothetical protein
MKTNLPKKQKGGRTITPKQVKQQTDWGAPVYNIPKMITNAAKKELNKGFKKLARMSGVPVASKGGATRKMQMGGMIGMMSPGNLGKGSSPKDTRTPAQKVADQKKRDAQVKKQNEDIYKSYKSLTDPKKRAAAQKKFQEDIKSGKIKISRNGGAIKSKK